MTQIIQYPGMRLATVDKRWFVCVETEGQASKPPYFAPVRGKRLILIKEHEWFQAFIQTVLWDYNGVIAKGVEYAVSEGITGRSIVWHAIFAKAVENARELLENFVDNLGPEAIQRTIITQARETGISPRYREI